MTLSADEFLGGFLLHLLPKDFVRIRNYGFLANRRRAALYPICFRSLGSAPQTTAAEDRCAAEHIAHLWTFPRCGGPMILIMRLSTAAIFSRSPSKRSLSRAKQRTYSAGIISPTQCRIPGVLRA